MVEIRPIGDKNKYIINRGAAIEKDDNLIVQDIKPNTDLFDNTGTSGNFGMTKMIHKHGLTKQEVKKIPKLLREYKTTGIRPENNTYQWRVPLDSKDDFIFSFAPKEKHVLKRNILKEITIHKKGVGKNKDIPLSQKNKELKSHAYPIYRSLTWILIKMNFVSVLIVQFLVLL